MIEKTISFNDLRGNAVTDTFYFNMSGAEMAELAMSRKGLDEYLTSIIKTEDVKELFVLFKELLGLAVGKMINDRVFEKSPELTAEFMYSGAYEELFFELIGNPLYAADFIKGLMPDNLEARVEQVMKGQQTTQEYTDEQLLAMTEDEFHKVAGSDPKDWGPRFLQIAFQRKTAA